MNPFQRMPLYRYGARFSERILLPALIDRIEPRAGRDRDRSGLPEIEPVVTEYELRETVGKYRLSNTFMVYALILFLSLVAFAVASLLKLASAPVTIPPGIAALAHLVCLLLAFLTWLGAFQRVRQRRMEWQDIEKAKALQEQQAQKARSYSAIGTDTMRMFEEMMDKREEKNRSKSRVLTVLAFFAGYLAEKGLDRVLLAIATGSMRGA